MWFDGHLNKVRSLSDYYFTKSDIFEQNQKKFQKKASRGITPWLSSWEDMDKAFDNFRRYIEKSFASFPSISIPSFPKIPETSCDVIDEGKQLRVKMNVPGVQKKDIKLNVTDNSWKYL